jgi:PAT family beta-lactamase induction signal transducer AmpG
VLVAVTNMLFAALAWWGQPDIRFLMATISADNLAAGFAGTVFIAYLSSLTSVAYTATQYALFSALMTLLGNFIGGFSGRVVEATDWVSFFLYASAMGLPAIVLSVIVARRARTS